MVLSIYAHSLMVGVPPNLISLSLANDCLFYELILAIFSTFCSLILLFPNLGVLWKREWNCFWIQFCSTDSANWNGVSQRKKYVSSVNRFEMRASYLIRSHVRQKVFLTLVQTSTDWGNARLYCLYSFYSLVNAKYGYDWAGKSSFFKNKRCGKYLQKTNTAFFVRQKVVTSGTGGIEVTNLEWWQWITRFGMKYVQKKDAFESVKKMLTRQLNK